MYALHCPYDSKRVWIWHISDATFVLQTNQSCWTDVIPVSFSDALYMLKNKRFMPAYDLIQPTARAPARCCGIGWTRRSCPGATHDLDACVAQRRYTDATAHWALSCLMLHCVAWLGYMAPKKTVCGQVSSSRFWGQLLAVDFAPWWAWHVRSCKHAEALLAMAKIDPTGTGPLTKYNSP